MDLPLKKDLPVHLLAACFNNTSATYKFYWLLSILQSVERGERVILKKDLFARMISNAWFTVNYFHISFGKQDRLQRAIELVRVFESLNIDDDRELIFSTLAGTTRLETLEQLKYFNNQVPHWFISPWFPKLNKTEIYQASQNFENNCLYALHHGYIRINPAWEDYLTDNGRILKDFCYWNLASFLQSKNPSVPDIPNKLIKPATRISLTKQRTDFWDIVIRELGSVDCIYTGARLTVGKYDVEHFIPYSFVSHDLMWNLIPADPSFNSSKSNRLPPLERYFSSFYHLQRTAIDIVRDKNPKNRFLEDYLTIFPDLYEIRNLPENFTKDKFRGQLQPLIKIASNNGFEFME